VVGNTAYVQDLFSGIYVLDVTDPTAPVLLDQIEVGVQPRGIAVAGDHVCVISANSSVRVVDIGSVGSPQLLPDCLWEGTPFDIKAAGDVVYVADGGLTALRLSERRTYSVSLPALRAGQEPPVPIALVSALPWSTLTATPSGIDTGAPYWYRAVTTGYGKGYLDILSLRNPAAPVLVGRYTAPNSAYPGAWAEYGERLYVTYGKRTSLVDISDAGAPTTLASWDSPETAGLVLERGHLLAIARVQGYDAYYLKVYSLADPASPVEVGSCQIDVIEGVSGIKVVGNTAWVNATDWRSHYYGQFVAIDIADLGHPTKRGSCYVEGYGRKPAFSGAYAYVGSGRRNQLTSVYLGDASAPRVEHHLPLPGNSGDTVIWGAYACTSVGAYVAVVDVSDPRAPALRILWGVGAPVESLMVVGEYLYASTEGTLLILRLAHAP
jgi:hypothetical protein